MMQSQLKGLITTGGGFSNHYPRPFWQDSAVNNYLSANTPFLGFNSAGRGYPDVSLLGVNYAVASNLTIETGIYGTSASAPVFAAMGKHHSTNAY